MTSKRTRKDSDLDSEESSLFKIFNEELHNTQMKNVYDFAFLSYDCINEISKKLPQTKAELLKIDHMTELLFDRYGTHLLEGDTKMQIDYRFYARAPVHT